MLGSTARLAAGHALTWLAHGVVVAVLVTDTVGRPGAPHALALGTAVAIAAAAAGLLAPPRVRSTTLVVAAAALAAGASVGAGVLAMLGQPPHLAVAAVLGLSAGVQAVAVATLSRTDRALAPRVRPAPTLLFAGIGVLVVAVLDAVPMAALAWTVFGAALLQLVVIGLAAALVTGGATAAAVAVAPAQALRSAPPAPAARPIPPAVLIVIGLVVAGGTAVAALRPALSALGLDTGGAEVPHPAGPMALTLLVGATLGPPIARLAVRFGDHGAAALATLGGGAALIAPIARAGVLDLIAAAFLGVALAASVALVEIGRRGNVALPRAGVIAVLLVGAAGSVVAALLLGAVPLADVVLGAALTCMVASIGAWVPR